MATDDHILLDKELARIAEKTAIARKKKREREEEAQRRKKEFLFLKNRLLETFKEMRCENSEFDSLIEKIFSYDPGFILLEFHIAPDSDNRSNIFLLRLCSDWDDLTNLSILHNRTPRGWSEAKSERLIVDFSDLPDKFQKKILDLLPAFLDKKFMVRHAIKKHRACLQPWK